MIWDRPKLEDFKRATADAVEKKAETFIFEGHEILPSYARYLIMYLDEKLVPADGGKR